MHLAAGDEEDDIYCSLEECHLIYSEFFDAMHRYSGLPDDKIVFLVGVVTLDPLPVPNYEALSYVWGELPESCWIICEGRFLAITQTLDAAIRKIRQSDTARTLWIDQICINQENTTERGMQVNLMGLIFANAKQTLMWLGPDIKNQAQGAIELIQKINTNWSTGIRNPERQFPSNGQLRVRGLPTRPDLVGML